MKKILAILLCTVVASCSKENPIEKERKEMEVFMASKDLLLYRGLKVTFRSLPAGSGDSTQLKSVSKIQGLSLALLQKILGVKSDSGFSFTDYFYAMSEMSELKEELAKSDEDKFPTILHNLFSVTGAETDSILSGYNSSCEHIILGLTWTGMGAPENFSVYEILRSKPEEITDPLFRLAGYFIKGMVLRTRKWQYSAEKEFDDYLSFLEKNKSTIIRQLSVSSVLGDKKMPDEKVYAGLHGPALLMRGFCRLESERQDEAEEDFSLFVKDAEKAGIDNEGVWLIRAYVAISDENKEEAVKMLDRLSESEKLGDAEKEMIGEVKKFVSGREKDKALNKITDKLFIAKVAYLYAEKQVASISWYQQLTKNGPGSKFSELAETLNENYSLISGDVTETVKQRTKDLYNSLFK